MRYSLLPKLRYFESNFLGGLPAFSSRKHACSLRRRQPRVAAATEHAKQGSGHGRTGRRAADCEPHRASALSEGRVASRSGQATVGPHTANNQTAAAACASVSVSTSWRGAGVAHCCCERIWTMPLGLRSVTLMRQARVCMVARSSKPFVSRLQPLF